MSDFALRLGVDDLVKCTTASTTHLMWAGRWIEVKAAKDAWIFKNGYDARDWLLS